ncbi:shikimate kinase [bacterium]|nr:MAG: shikimate kinase [bacterium]
MNQSKRPDPSIVRKDRIYLTGFMGCGKSTIGPILANTIGYDFVDVDRQIEQAEGRSINEIFSEKGEKHFRDLERTVLMKVCSLPRTVISLGGGTMTVAENLEVILATGLVVYLKITPEQLFHRLRHRSDRPLLRTADGSQLGDEELRARIQLLYEAREPLYARADVIVLTDGTKLGLTVDSIVRRLSGLIE